MGNIIPTKALSNRTQQVSRQGRTIYGIRFVDKRILLPRRLVRGGLQRCHILLPYARGIEGRLKGRHGDKLVGGITRPVLPLQVPDEQSQSMPQVGM